MKSAGRRPARRDSYFAALLGSASLAVLTSSLPAGAQQAQTAQAAPEMVPEQVLVTGSLIHGAAAVGVPVTTLGTEDFHTTGSLTTTDLFKTIPYAMVPAFQSTTDAGSKVEQTETINIRGLNSKGPRTLMLVDGFRFPGQGDSGCQVDPSIIPALAIDRVDILADGASATYGSDAIAGVVNLILRRGYEGAITEGSFGTSPGYGHDYWRGSQLYGTKWDSGDFTVTYEYYNQDHVDGTKRPYYTMDFNAAQGLDNRTPLANSLPGEVSVGAPTLATQFPGGAVNNVTTLPGTPGNFSATSGTSCGNCFAIPAGQNGQGLTWAQILANPGVKNLRNPFADAWGQPSQARSAVVGTFDQNIVPGIQFFADGFYDNRRSELLSVGGPNTPDPGQNNAFNAFAVPTTNPYYPAGAPAGLRVNYDISFETPPSTAGNELAQRYDFGFNLELPFNWTGKLYSAVSDDKEVAVSTGLVNLGNASAALGWTVPAGAVLASFAKPANVPYLNLFCDPTAFQCNSPATIAYITGYRDFFEENIIHEYGATADGSIIQLPGGDLKAAVGAVYDHYSYYDEYKENFLSSSTAQIVDATEYHRRQVYAAFTQINIPLVGDNNRLPLVERANVETSVRYDNYNDFGGTTNPKVAGDWLVFDGLKLNGEWGTSFRAPTFQEAGYVSGALDQPLNQASGGGSNNYGTCPVVGKAAVAGSIAAIIDPNCTQALQFLGGIRLGNGAALAAPVRPAGSTLAPEKAQNVSGGFDFAPDDPILRGLDINMTYYFVKIRNKLQGCDVGTTSRLDDPAYTSCYTVGVSNPNFSNQVVTLLNNPRSTFAAGTSPTVISFIADGAIRNIGWQSTNGVDFNASYNYDAGDLGAWNTGVTGTYVLDNYSVTNPGAPIISTYSTTQNGTRNSGGRLRYRARLGWAGGPDNAFSIVGFMNFIPHVNANGGSLAPLCFVQGNTACDASGLPQFAQYTQQFPTLSNFVPSMYTFDMSLSYRTGDAPANRYLKNLQFTLTVNDITNRAPPFQYSVATNSNTPHAFYNGISADQRFFTVVVTKAW